MQELLNHIKAQNAKTRAWVAEDPKNRFAGEYPEDEAHWVERGISTLAELERDELITYIWDGHKDAYGFRNRNYDFDSMSLEELKAESDRISNAVKEAMEEDRAREKANIENLESRIKSNIDRGAADRQTAVRWILQAEDLIGEWDIDYINFSLGIPYGHMKKEFELANKEANTYDY
jgi:hypothetical protein|tara:strand:- start:2648 stop:3178 length:531 start_codon:yes stop_codon:yes gene_type:complete